MIGVNIMNLKDVTLSEKISYRKINIALFHQ